MNKKYGVILADPPWQYQNYASKPGTTHNRQRGAQKHYGTMNLADIAALPIPALCADSCALFVWATWPLIEDAFGLIRSWGFEYKTLAWEWIKLNQNSMGMFVGMGYYTRSNPEPCLLAFRGKPIPVVDRAVSAVLMSPVRDHSQKPQEQYERIERLYPDMDYLELFARHQHSPKWNVWGNQVSSTIEIGCAA